MDDQSSPIRFHSLAKEAGLGALALFYFVIATNTQTGWLFVMSAFLLGLLMFSALFSRRGVRALEVRQFLGAEPQRGLPARVSLTLKNKSPRAVSEIRLESLAPEWASPESELRWAVPRLHSGEQASTDYSLTCQRRGEHRLPPVKVVSGAPFGLFSVSRLFHHEQSFLVYPAIEKLPQTHTRARVAISLGELVSPRDRGDSHSLRALREYAPGDDLRHVHWKASAKRGGNLLIREHHAQAPSRVQILLDSSAQTDEFSLAFERAVVLAASVLWAAHREGTQTELGLLDGEGKFVRSRHWPDQYKRLAQIQPSVLTFEAWWSKVAPDLDLRRERPHLLTALLQESLDEWPGGIHSVFLLQLKDGARQVPEHPRLVRLDAQGPGFQELVHV